MKSILAVLIFILVIFYNCSGIDKRPEKVKNVYKTVYKAADVLKNRYGLRYIGISVSSHKKLYTVIGASFQILRPLSKEEGRKILVDSAQELLHQINSNLELQPYLDPSPFETKNVEVVFFAYAENGRDLSHPDITDFVLREGIIKYTTLSSENRNRAYSTERESYEEALRIVQEGQSGN
jgi:hypothetical protein